MRMLRSAGRTGILLVLVFTMSACGNDGAPPASAPTLPSPPTHLTISPADEALMASWILSEDTPAASPTSTIVEYATGDRSNWTTITPSTPTSVTIPNLENYTPTWIRVARRSVQEQSAWLTHDSPAVPRPVSTPGPTDDPSRAPSPGEAFTDTGSATSIPTLTLDAGRILVEQPGVTTLALITSASDANVPTFYAGSTIPFTMTGFAPGSVMEVVLHSEPQSLGLHDVTVTPTDTNQDTGIASGNIVIPGNLEPGNHGLHFRGRTQDGSPLRLGLGVTARPHPSGITHVTLVESVINLGVGDTFDLEDVGATVHGNHEGNAGVTWTVTDPRIATLDEGRVIGVDVGTTTLVAAATAAPSIRAEATVTVSDTSPVPGNLTVTVDQPDTTVTVRRDDMQHVKVVDDTFTWVLAPGTYTVTASKLGFAAPGPSSAVVVSGETTTLALSLTQIMDPFTMHVSQHVLTWAGSNDGSSTLPASSSAWSAGETFLSTVHLRFTNLGDAPMTSVQLSNAVPEAVGVVVPTITRGGSYDSVTHTVTWSNPQDGAELPVGGSVEVSFDVYARQQPGVAWEGAFNPDAAVPSPAASGQADPPHVVTNPAFETVVFNDPYRIANGAKADSVKAAATVVSRTEPYVWSFTPPADDGDIWVVRPLFDLDVQRSGALVVSQNDLVTFTTTVQQIDRVSTAIDPAWTEYAFLDVLYPWEFGGSLNGGTGHRPEGASPRSNPHARDVALFNSFEWGLDFTTATDVDEVPIGASSPKVNGLDVDYSTVEHLPRGVSVSTELVLAAQLASEASPGDTVPESMHGARYVVTMTDESFAADGSDGSYGWLTCAYLASPQLWQPATTTPAFTEDSIYELHASGSYPSMPESALASSALWAPRNQVSAGQGIDPIVLVKDWSGAIRIPSHAGTSSVDGLLEQCAAVAINQIPDPTPMLLLNLRGHYDGAHPDAQVLGSLVNLNDVWFVHVTIVNSSTTTATNVDLSVSLTDASVTRFEDASPQAHLRSDVGQSWSPTSTTTPSTLLPNRVAMEDLTIPGGASLNLAFGMTAVGEGSTEVSTRLAYDRSDGPMTLDSTNHVVVIP